MDALVVGIYLGHREDLGWKLRGYLVHGECHCFDVKDSNFRALGKKLESYNDDR